MVDPSNQVGGQVPSFGSIDGDAQGLEESNMIQLDRKWIARPTSTAPMPVGLIHIDSRACWCEPDIEIDEAGQQVVLHRQVTWN